MKHLFLLAILLTASLGSLAEDVGFTYNLNDEKTAGYGFTTAERYDVAILIKEPALTGSRVKGITAFLPEKGGSVAETCRGWTGTSLPEKGTDCSGLATAASGTVSGTTISIDFPEPAVIPAEGLYVGYTIDVTEITSSSSRSYPVQYVSGTTPGSLYLRTTSRADWIDQADRSERMSTMIVTLDAPLPTNGASVALQDVYQVKAGTTASLPVTIANHGLSPITSISYTYKSGNTSGEGSLTLPTPLDALFGKTTVVNIPAESGEKLGDTPLEISVTKVNGAENTDPQHASQTIMSVLPEVPVYRPLVEEYSGLWCMSCPAGYVAIEEGREQFGDDFVALAYHYNDDMVVTGVNFPNRVSSYPTIWLDRKENVNVNTALDVWQEYRRNGTDLDVQCDIEWTDNKRTNLKATARVTSMQQKSGKFRICYALVADGLSNPSWGQANNFSGALLSGKFWELFTKGGGYVYGLTFNDIVCLLPEPAGFEGSLPDALNQFEQYSHSYTFNVTTPRMQGGVRPCDNRDNLRVVAIVLDAETNRALNCINSDKSANAPIASGIYGTIAERDAVMTKYIDLEGRQLASEPENIPYIRVSIFKDGTSRSEKIMNRK